MKYDFAAFIGFTERDIASVNWANVFDYLITSKSNHLDRRMSHTVSWSGELCIIQYKE